MNELRVSMCFYLRSFRGERLSVREETEEERGKSEEGEKYTVGG